MNLNNKPKKAPVNLSKEGKTLWNKLLNEYSIEDEAGLLILQTCCEAHDRMKECQTIIKTEGMQVADRFGQMKAHPLTVTERDSRSAMMQALKSLNLDLEPLNDRAGRPAGR
ncbi:MAG: phage terminase small subunit P27 family [Desulfuromonadaceae bacterium]|nr:phage terminase small subunit P27 family [Desulfuromonadaceae bacterium]MDD5106286.1 phage terminase small subunit P27 family [Desulfuromonadaceae bacterium]